MGADIVRGGVLAVAVAILASSAQADPAPQPRTSAMLDRPLFSPSRRPPPPPPAPLEAPAMPNPASSRPDLTLSGVIAGGGGGVALVRRPQDGAPTRLALGGEVDGWTLAVIRPRAIVLRRDGRDVTVELPAP